MNHGKKMEECKLHRTDLSDAEFAKAQDEMFAALDTDKNGAIGRDEFTSHHEEMRRSIASMTKRTLRRRLRTSIDGGIKWVGGN